MDTAEYIRHLEEELLNPFVRRDTRRVAALLADDFIEFGSSGQRFDKAQTLECLRNDPERPGTVLRDFVVNFLGSAVALATYRTIRQDESRVEAWRSSIWIRCDDGWQLKFHQGTRIALMSQNDRITSMCR